LTAAAASAVGGRETEDEERRAHNVQEDGKRKNPNALKIELKMSEKEARKCPSTF
jgi:hypothetical protein